MFFTEAPNDRQKIQELLKLLKHPNILESSDARVFPNSMVQLSIPKGTIDKSEALRILNEYGIKEVDRTPEEIKASRYKSRPDNTIIKVEIGSRSIFESKLAELKKIPAAEIKPEPAAPKS